MKGWLIVNEFLHSQKFTELNLEFINSAKRLEIDLEIKTNGEILSDIRYEKVDKSNWEENDRPDFILFWDKDIRLANFLENCGFLIFNSSKAIAICDDKSLTHLTLMNSGIKMPRTMIAPMTYSNINYTNYNFLYKVSKELSFPFILKECFGSFGQQVYIIKNQDELIAKVNKIGGKPMIFQEYVKSSTGRDIRLQVVGDKVVAAMYRYSSNGDFRANITNGGQMKNYTPTKEQIEVAVKCCKKIGLDFAGVDILFGEEDEPIVCEVNSNAHFKNIYDCTGVNVADHIMKYISNQITNLEQ